MNCVSAVTSVESLHSMMEGTNVRLFEVYYRHLPVAYQNYTPLYFFEKQAVVMYPLIVHIKITNTIIIIQHTNNLSA